MITRWTLDWDRVAWVTLIAAFLAGIAAYYALPQASDPALVTRWASVITPFPGAAPDRVERLVSEPLEDVIDALPDVRWTHSISRSGISVVNIRLHDRVTEVEPVWDEVRRELTEYGRGRPEGVHLPALSDVYANVYGVVVTLTGDGFTDAELERAAREVRSALMDLDNTGEVKLWGVQDERITVAFDNSRLAGLGLSPLQLAELLSTQNVVLPGGDVRVGSERIALEPSGAFESVDDIRRLVVPVSASGDVVHLEDVASVTRGTVEPFEMKVHQDGRPAIALGVTVKEGGSIVALGDEVVALVRAQQEVLPIGLDLHLAIFEPADVAARVDRFTGTLVQAVLLVCAVMLGTLGLRTGLVVSSLIPGTILLTFLGMRVFGVGVDQISLAALIIALGMLVDNAIVVSEAILVRMREGLGSRDAAIATSSELAGPLLTSSLTTAVAFLPIYLSEGDVGEYCSPLFVVVSLALLASWILSLTLVPLLAVALLRVDGDDPPEAGRAQTRYRSGLRALALHPWSFAAVLAMLMVAALVGFGQLPKSFFPPTGRSLFLAEMRLPPGTAPEHTEAVATAVEAHLASTLQVTDDRPDGVTSWSTWIGQGAPRFLVNQLAFSRDPTLAVMVVHCTDLAATNRAMDDLRAWVTAHHPEVQIRVNPTINGPPVLRAFGVRLYGDDIGALYDRAAAIKARLDETPGAYNIDDDWGPWVKTLDVAVDQVRARQTGLTSREVALSLLTSLTGLPATTYREDDKTIPVILRSSSADRQDVGKLDGLQVYSASTRRSVPLKQVADVRLDWQTSTIKRRHGRRSLLIGADVGGGVSPFEVAATMEPFLDELDATWPPGDRWNFEGEVKRSGESSGSLAAALPLAVAVIVILLVLQFNSIRKTGIVLATIPLGVIGVVGGMLLTGATFGFMAALGVVSLAGIVINNAVVLLDRIAIEESLGRSPAEAVLEASQRRLRPILLTTATTVAGLFPLWLGGGAMWEPMAIGIMSGLVFATVLTLGLVPVMYGVLYRVDFDD